VTTSSMSSVNTPPRPQLTITPNIGSRNGGDDELGAVRVQLLHVDTVERRESSPHAPTGCGMRRARRLPSADRAQRGRPSHDGVIRRVMPFSTTGSPIAPATRRAASSSSTHSPAATPSPAARESDGRRARDDCLRVLAAPAGSTPRTRRPLGRETRSV
jgi:hypothetical protein